MKKSIRVKLSMILCAVMMFQLSGVYASEDIPYELQIQLLIEQQARAVKAADLINNGMGLDENGTIDYEDELAGLYIEEDKLIIALVDTSDEVKQKYVEWAGEYSDILVFEKVAYSYDCLNNRADDMIDSLREQTGKANIGYYVSEVDNSIVLKVDEETKGMLEKSRTVLTTDIPIDIEVGDTLESLAVEVGGGDSITNATAGGGALSVGCCGYFRGSLSIATCGHGSSIGDKFWVGSGSGGVAGTVAYHNYVNGGNGDYAVISGPSSGYTFTNKVGSDYQITGMTTSPVVGTLVYFYGATTHQYCAGQVVSRGGTYTLSLTKNGTITYTTVKDLTCVRILEGMAQHGDSGGTVFNAVEFGNGNVNFCGVINAGGTHETGEAEMYFTPAAYFSSIGFTAKTS